ncbi:hypothetical protein BU25DRAFT_120320 [Macroventuria anomochaeta]|uniref:Uncharacterized protein n=1 Tax=Macroventuria anomochaeta TaxID=301207 RepID=A0ACB6RUB3_9PLEO|nr:uncharacterized protein BU25DRAFT_120320 [Macroventuria anomochaeta]KAF2625369.1 hypothetical protein BU25DRAFT_120320 [Macroventuria anomochaeta]
MGGGLSLVAYFHPAHCRAATVSLPTGSRHPQSDSHWAWPLRCGDLGCLVSPYRSGCSFSCATLNISAPSRFATACLSNGSRHPQSDNYWG